MRKLLLNPTPLFRKLRQLSMLLTLLLALPQTAMGDDTTTYTFTGTSEISDHTGTATSTVDGAGSNTWSIKNFHITKENVAQNITPTAISNTLGYSNIGYSDCLADLTIESDFGITGSFVSATINYTTSGLTSGEVQVDKTDGNYNYPLTTGSGTYGKNTMDLNQGTITLNLNNNTDKKDFIDNHISFQFTFTPNNANSYFQINSITITTSTLSYGITVAGFAVTSENATNILGDGKVAFTPASEANDNKNILSLNNAVITTGGIESSIGDLTINLKGTNNIGDNSTSIATGISSTNNGTLTFTVDGSGGSLSINTTTSAVSGFADVTLGTGTYLYVGNPTKYDTNGKNFREQIGSANIVKVMQITSQAYYPLWVNGAQVSHLTPNTNLTFTAATNTLALSNAWIATGGIISGLDNLIITLTGNNNIQLSDTTAAIRSINPAATLTIQKSASAENGSLNMKNNVDGASSSPVIKNFASVSHTGLNFVSKTGTTLEAATVHDAVLSSAEIYPLWIDGTLVTAATHSFNGTSGTIDYSSETNTLTLTGYQNTFATGHAIETGIVGLKVKLIGASTINCSAESAVFHALNSSASIQFIKDDATSKLTMTGTAFSNFGAGKITYDGLFYYEGTEKYITQPSAPELAWEVNNDSYTYATIKYATTERAETGDGNTAVYNTANPVRKYSFDYADPNLTDVTNAEYPSGGIKLTSPGILTAWVEVSGIKSAESKGVRFGSIENPVEMEFNGMAKTIDFTLAPTMTNAVTPSVNSDYTASFNSFATLDATNNKITINSCYNGMIGFTFTNTDGGYTSLNDTTKITFNVTPPKPTLSVGGGKYDEAQTVTIAPNYQGTATIKYYFGEAEASSETYTTALTISETKTLTAWVEVNGVKSDTVQATYTIRQAANLSYSAETATALIEESEITFTAPTLTNTNQINITYSSSNEQVATISNTGDVTILGAGTTTISATPTDATTYIPTPASYVLTVTRNIINPFSDVMEGQNFATYYNHNEDLALPEGLTAYIVTGVSGTTVTITATGYLPKDVPLLLEKTGELAESLEMNGYSGEAGNFSSNKLKYVNMEAGETASGDQYVLYMNEFVKATGTIPQGKCYLDLTGVSGSRGMYGIGGDGSTGIQGIGREATENGQWYDLQGRRIQQPTKAGIYIVNGKKVIINKK